MKRSRAFSFSNSYSTDKIVSTIEFLFMVFRKKKQKLETILTISQHHVRKRTFISKIYNFDKFIVC